MSAERCQCCHLLPAAACTGPAVVMSSPVILMMDLIKLAKLLLASTGSGSLGWSGSKPHRSLQGRDS